MFQARLHRHIPGRCSLESRTLRHQRSSFESPTYFSLFYEGSREAMVNRITFVSSTSKTIGIRHQKWCRSSFISGFCLLNPANSAPSSVTECHADDGRRIADRYSQRQRPVWLSRFSCGRCGVQRADPPSREARTLTCTRINALVAMDKALSIYTAYFEQSTERSQKLNRQGVI